MHSQRVEVRLNPANPEIKQLIEELEALPDEYGRNTAFLKERLVRGFMVLRREVDALQGQPDPLKALDARAKSGAEFRSQYRILQVMLKMPLAGEEPAVSVGRKPKAAAVAAAAQAPEQRGAAHTSPLPVPSAAEASTEVSPIVLPAVVASTPREHDFEDSHTGAAMQDDAPIVGPTDDVASGMREMGALDVTAAGGEAESAPPVAKPTRDWSKFAGLAGTKGGRS